MTEGNPLEGPLGDVSASLDLFLFSDPEIKNSG
jgi:hypothetical protein